MLSRSFCHGWIFLSGFEFMAGKIGVGGGGAEAAQHKSEKKQATGDGDETAEPHDAEAQVFSGRAEMLLGGVLFAAEPVGAGEGETKSEHRLPAAEEQQLQPGATRGTISRGFGGNVAA